MAKPLNWTPAAKALTVAIAGLILSIGLCSAGGGFDTHVSQAQIAMTYLGGFLFVGSIVLLLVGLAKSGDARRRR